MALRPFTNIQIQQVPTQLWSDRKELIELDFVHDYKIEKGWENHTNCCEVTLPKNIILKTDEFLFKQSGTYNVIMGGSGAIRNNKNYDEQGNKISYPPLLMRGDVIYIQDGYHCKNEHRQNVQYGRTKFAGFISKVHSEVPIKIECEDAFYLLKRTPVGKNIWTTEIISLCKYMIDQVNSLFGLNSALEINGVNPYPVLSFYENPDSLTANFSLGHLDIGDITCAELLSRLRGQYKLESFFKDNVLHFGFPIYDEATANNQNVFEFQNNIFEDCQLEYKNKDDIVLSAIVSCKAIKKTNRTTHDGSEHSKQEKLSVLVYWDIPTETFKFIEKKTGVPFPANEGGERHEFIYALDLTKPKPSFQELADYGIEHLKKYFYTGFRGSFKTFGFPFVEWNDNVWIIDKVFADRNGCYKVKKVEYTGGVDSLEQEIFLDYKINIDMPKPEDFDYIYMI